MAGEQLDSIAISNLDGPPPYVQNTAGEGAAGELKTQQDYVVHTTNFGANGGAGGSYDRQSRFPVDAMVKRVMLYTKGLDSSSSQTLTLDVNVAFSDSTIDGTPVGAQGQIPTTGLTGAVTTPTAYSSPNVMFGSGLTVAASGAVQYEEVTYKNTFTPALAQEPMWAVMGSYGAATAAPFSAGGGFAQQGGSGQICSPGGFFDILVAVNHTSTTNATGTVGTEVDFVL